jgi:hypothetical protein
MFILHNRVTISKIRKQEDPLSSGGAKQAFFNRCKRLNQRAKVY